MRTDPAKTSLPARLDAIRRELEQLRQEQERRVKLAGPQQPQDHETQATWQGWAVPVKQRERAGL